MVGHPVNRFTNLSKREETLLICSICHNIFNDPIKTECEHTFCKTCLQEWIQSKHSDCPNCRRKFQPLKRTAQNRDDPNVILLSKYVFKRNLMAKSFVDELETKCDFEFNGCQQLIEFGSLEAHIKECEHRICSKCGVTLGRVEDHNCVDQLINDRNRLKQELNQSLDQISVHKGVVNSYEQTINELKDKISKLESEIERIATEEKTHKKERNEFESKYNYVFEINKQLVNRISREQQLVNSCEDLKEKNSKLESEMKSVSSELKTRENETKDLKSKYETVLETNKQLDNHLTKEISTSKQLRVDFKKLNDKCLSLESQLDLLLNNRDFWRQKFSASKQESVDSSQLITDEMKDKLLKLQTQLETNEKTINEWKDKYKNLLENNNQLKPNDNNYEDINNYLSLMTEFDQQNDSEDIKVINIVRNERRRRSCAKLAKDLQILDKTYSFEEQMKRNNQIIENKNQLITSFRNEVQHYLNGLFFIAQRICPSIEFIRFGTFNTSAQKLLLTDSSIKLISVMPNKLSPKYDLSIPFDAIDFLNDYHFRTLSIKLKTNCCENFKEILNLDDNSPNDYKFDVNSKDPKESYIVIAFSVDAHIYNFFIRYLKLVEPPISFRQKSDSNTECMPYIKTEPLN